MRCRKCSKDYPSLYYFRTRAVCNDCFDALSPEAREQLLRNLNQETALTSTAFTIEGKRIVKSLGVVRGITVRSRSIFGTIGASLQTIVGGDITLFTELCEKTRSEAFEMMVEHALEMGANGVIGVRYDATEVMSGVNEVLCYGTAVIMEPAA